MVVIVDLDDDAPPAHAPRASGKPLHHSLAAAHINSDSNGEQTAEGRPNPNINGFSAALSCYPIVRQLARQLDLNTLHDLSRTCRQFRANLLEYRDQLIKHTLRCDYEGVGGPPRLQQRLREVHADYRVFNRIVSRRKATKAACARDMVGECSRCGSIVCRNCTIKPPPTPQVRARHRRLCRTCSKSPLQLLTACDRSRSMSCGTPSPPASPHPRPSFIDDESPRAFTAAAFERTPCTCDNVVWLCEPCGQQLRNADTMYIRAWTWRTRYSHYLGGVGTGAGEGNEGVECGRGPICLAAKIVEHEVDYDAEVPPNLESTSPERWTGTSYHAQEIEGIGGILKIKAKKQVRVGETVKIYEDERDKSIQYLEREVNGKLRSWCRWCERVVLGEKDKAILKGERPPSSGSSSTSSTK